jgi:hypothetical protein
MRETPEHRRAQRMQARECELHLGLDTRRPGRSGIPPRRPTGAEAGKSCRLSPRRGEPARGSGPRALPRRVAPARRARGHNRANPTASMPQAPRGILPPDRKRRGSRLGTVLSSRS